MKYKGMDILFTNKRKSGIVCFSVFDMGAKFKVYSIHDGISRYEQSFETLGEAVNYAKKIF